MEQIQNTQQACNKCSSIDRRETMNAITYKRRKILQLSSMFLIMTLIAGSTFSVFNSVQEQESDDSELSSFTIEDIPPSPRGTRAAQEFWTYVYTMDQITLFSYKDGTTITLYDDQGGTRWFGTLDKGEYGEAQNLLPGVYEARGDEKFSVMTMSREDPLVGGFHAKDENGYGLSCELYTYVPTRWTPYEKLIIFSYEDNTQVNLSYIDGTPIWSGTLNDGEHYADSSLDDSYLYIAASKPVSALSYYDQGYEVPSTDKSFVGTKFYTYAGRVGNWTNDANVMAYEDGTEVWIRRTNDGFVFWNGILNAGEIHTESYATTEEYLTIESTKNVATTVFPTQSYEGYYCMSHFPDDTGYGIGKKFMATTLSDLWSPGYMYITAFEDNTTVNVNFDSFDKPSLDSDDVYFLANASDYVQANKGWGLNLITSDKKISVMSGYETAHASFVPLQFGLDYPDLIPVNVSVDGSVVSAPVVINPGQVISVSSQAKNNETAPTKGITPFYSNSLMPLGSHESSSVQTELWQAPLAQGKYYINISVDPYDSIMEKDERNNIFTIEIWVRGEPEAPVFYNKVKDGTMDILLYWTPPQTPFTDHYLIYRSESQIGFDFTDVWIDTSTYDDNGILPLRTTFNDTNAASSGEPKEYYYCLRTVNYFGDVSVTSNTVGKWTKHFPGPVTGAKSNHVSVSEHNQTLGTLTGFSAMQSWTDGGANADLVEEGLPGFKTGDVIENGAFTEGLDWYAAGWDETETIGSGSTYFDNTTNAPGGSGGSIIGKTRESVTIPGGFNAVRSQTISEIIPASSFGNLSFYWRKEYVGSPPDSSSLSINLIKPDDSSVSLWQNSDSTWNVWTSELIFLDTSYFDQSGTYKIELTWTIFSMMTLLPETSCWFDEIILNLTMPQTYYQMDIQTNIKGVIVDEGNDLEIYGYTTGEPFEVQVWDGSTWNSRVSISDTYPRHYRYQLNPISEIIGGNVITRFVDKDPIESFQDSIVIDYQRVTSYNGGTSTFSLPLEPFKTNSVDWYADQIPKAISIKWSHATGFWRKHLTVDDPGVTDDLVEVGKGYEIYSGECYFTFCGSPAANIRYQEGKLPAPANFNLDVNQITGVVTLSWDAVSSPDLDRYQIYKTSSRLQIRELTIPQYDFTASTTWVDPLPVAPGENWYYFVCPVNASSTIGYNSTYSIGVTQLTWGLEYATLGLPNKPFSINSLDWYCNAIAENWGLNYYYVPEQRWIWHKTIMSKGAYDPDLVMAEGYQVSNTALTEYSFVGI
jgi:hypothetical protein